MTKFKRTSEIGQALLRMTTHFCGATQGNVAMIFAIAMPVLILLTFGGVDIHRASSVRANLQDALDAATLAAARSSFTEDDKLTEVGLAALQANLKSYPEVTLRVSSVSFTLDDDDSVIANASVDVDALVANIVLPPYGKFLDDTLPVGAHSEVQRATRDIEVSLVLDITGSMEGQRLTDLKAAANELVDLVVQPNQDVNRTRMALVPYSMGVNAGSYLNTVRGTAVGSTTIIGAAWMVADTQKTISAINKANPGVFTSNGHGYLSDQFVWISGVTDAGGSGSDLAGWLNGKAYQVVKIDNNTFSLKRWSGSAWVGVTTSGYQSYTASSGIARRCHVSTCEVMVTSNNHGLHNNDDVRILNVRGMTEINTKNAVSRASNDPLLSRPVTKQSDNTFSLNGIVGPTTNPLSAYTSGGTVQCLEYGCANYAFTNNENQPRVYGATDCVSERTGGEAYTDAASSVAHASFIYTGTDNVGQGGCMTTTFSPLTSTRDTLHTAINGYKAEGGTAGQIGVGWGWYMISPAFADIFPTENRPDPYGTKGLLKVVIIMTDGEFNAVYYNGVRARDSGTGGGTNERWINHDSNNGNPFIQSVNLCEGMKEEGIIVYTVGFDITSTSNNTVAIDSAQEVMQACATSPAHVFLPETGSSLKTAFAAIGRSISQLRITK